MKLGIFAKTFEGDTPHAVLSAARAAGYQAVQYNMACSGLGPLPTNVSDDVAEAIAAAAHDTAIEIAAVSATYNMTHPDVAKRQEGRRSFGAIASSMSRMGCGLITVCSGSRDAQDQWHHHPDNGTDAAWQTMIEEFRHLVPVAERVGVLIGVEPERANIVNSAAKGRALLDWFRSGPIRIVLDPANLFEADEVGQAQQIIRDAIALLGPDIALAHAKDRNADGSFATAGQGVVDWDLYLGALKAAHFDGAVVTHGLKASEAEGVATFLAAKLALGRSS